MREAARSKRVGLRAGMAMLAAGALLLSGCSAMFGEQPPQEVRDATNESIELISSIDGVAKAYPMLSLDRDGSGSPSAPAIWRLSVAVDVEPDVPELEALADSFVNALAQAGGYVIATGYLSIPADTRGAFAHVGFSDSLSFESAAQTVADANALRAIEGVVSATVARGEDSTWVSVASPADWPAVTAGIRAMPGFGGGALRSVTVSAKGESGASAGQMIVDQTWPAPAFIEFLAELAATKGVRELRLDGVRRFSEGTPMRSRPTLTLEVASRAEAISISGLVSSVDDSVALTSGHPRPAFVVTVAGGEPISPLESFVGLPRGSRAPDDLVDEAQEWAGQLQATEETGVSVIGLGPEASVERLAADQIAIEKLLTDAGDTAGIQGVASVVTQECADGAGQQVHGAVVIPIFEIVDNAQDAFGAIVESWSSSGVSRTDRAMGSDYFSSDDPDAIGAQKLSMRGKAEGISIAVTAACVVER